MRKKAETWHEFAKGDLEFAESIIKNGQRPHYAVHFCHQAIEKILKAVIAEHKDESPKRTHNFKLLCEQAGLELSPDHEKFFAKLSPHYLASKYPEDIDEFAKTYTASYAAQVLSETKRIFTWLEKILTSKK